MAGFFGKLFGKQSDNSVPVNFSALRTDIHSHLIPSVDDGSQSVEDSVEMIRSLMGLGFTSFITTPHIMSDAYPNTPEKINKGLMRLREGLAAAGLDVHIEAAAEYYLDEIFQDMLDEEAPLLTFGGSKRYLLFETSYMNKPLSLESVIFKMNTQGYKPVFAHPERYTYFWGDSSIEKLAEIYELGVKFQVNIGSLAGSYSKRAGSIATQLIEAGMVDFLGTDIHGIRQLESIKRAMEASPQLRDLVESNRLLNASLLPASIS